MNGMRGKKIILRILAYKNANLLYVRATQYWDSWYYECTSRFNTINVELSCSRSYLVEIHVESNKLGISLSHGLDPEDNLLN